MFLVFFSRWETQACVKFRCVDPCVTPERACGDRAECEVRNHKPICSCPRGEPSLHLIIERLGGKGEKRNVFYRILN